MSHSYDLIMLDEAQDIDECQADIIGNQTNCRVIVVGDPHQVRRENGLLADSSLDTVENKAHGCLLRLSQPVTGNDSKRRKRCAS